MALGVLGTVVCASNIAQESGGNLAAINTKIPADPAREGGNLATLAGIDFSTETTLAALLADFGLEDFATQTTLGTIDGKVVACDTTNLAVENGGHLAAVDAKLLDLAALLTVPTAAENIAISGVSNNSGAVAAGIYLLHSDVDCAWRQGPVAGPPTAVTTDFKISSGCYFPRPIVVNSAADNCIAGIVTVPNTTGTLTPNRIG